MVSDCDWLGQNESGVVKLAGMFLLVDENERKARKFVLRTLNLGQQAVALRRLFEPLLCVCVCVGDLLCSQPSHDASSDFD